MPQTEALRNYYDPEWTLPKAMRRSPEFHEDGNAEAIFLQSDLSESRYSYPALVAEMERRGRHLLALGLRKGDRAGLVVPDPEDFILTFLACSAVGVVPVPLFPPLGMGRIDHYVRDTGRALDVAGAKILLTSKRVQPILWSLVTDVPSIQDLVCVENLVGPAPAGTPEPEEVYPDDVCFLQFTSGSTAAPKGVVVTHRSLGANVQGIMMHGIGLHLHREDVSFSWLPLYHDMGFIGMTICPFTVGMNAVLLPTLTFLKRPSTWLGLMDKYRGSISFAPNFAFGLAVKRTKPARVAEMDLSCIRMLGAGAEPNHPGTIQTFLDHFAPAGLRPEVMLPVYGMAEATLAMSFSRRDHAMRTDCVLGDRYHDEGYAEPAHGKHDGQVLEFVSCGWALPEHSVHIVDERGRKMPDRVTGEIIFNGPSVTPGYFENQAATDAAFTDIGLHTGDMGYMVDGELFVTGRKKDLVILNGRNYDPHSIEWAVAEVDGVRKGNVVAFSTPGENTEHLVVVAEVRANQDVEALRLAVSKQIRDEFSLNPYDVRLVEAGVLPKTTSGKLQRRKTREMYLDRTLGVEGVRTLGDKGTAIKVAKHVARSMMSRVRHGVRRRVSTFARASG